MSAWFKNREKFAAILAPLIALAGLAGIVNWIGAGRVDHAFGQLVGYMEKIFFWKIGDYTFIAEGLEIPALNQLPLVVAVLFFGAIYFTFRFNFINVRGFKHGAELVSGRYDDPDDPGEVSHLQALSSALSATVGLGNIAGVAIAVNMGGPGAVFWMMVVAVFGMASKFAECSLGQIYRRVDSKGRILGGPMVYLKDGLAKMNIGNISLAGLGTFLSVLFSILVVIGSFAGGNMFQANQAFSALADQVPLLAPGKASGTVELTADEPKQVELPKHRIRFEVPPPNKFQDPISFIPKESLDLDKSDWQETGQGEYRTEIAIKSVNGGPTNNVESGTVETMKYGQLNEKKNSIAAWIDVIEPDKASELPGSLSGVQAVSNPSPASGGKGGYGLWFGIILAILVGVVIIGGIKSIGKVTEKIVPLMCGIYVLAGIAIMVINYHRVPDAVGTILSEAFTVPAAGWGGLVGVIVVGISRAAFSSEAGIGSASIAHSAAKTNEPVREGLVALLEPFIDTIIVCFITGFVIVVSGVYNDPTMAGLEGIELTTRAFGTQLGFFPVVLAIAVTLFAYSTMLSWSYYGERCWNFLLGGDQSLSYRVLFLIFIVIGSFSSLGNIVGLADMILLTMAFPNILGVVLLSGELKEKLESYWERYKAGEFEHQKQW